MLCEASFVSVANRRDYKSYIHSPFIVLVSQLTLLNLHILLTYLFWLWLFYWLLIQRRQNNLKAIVGTFQGSHDWGKRIISSIWTPCINSVECAISFALNCERLWPCVLLDWKLHEDKNRFLFLCISSGIMPCSVYNEFFLSVTGGKQGQGGLHDSFREGCLTRRSKFQLPASFLVGIIHMFSICSSSLLIGIHLDTVKGILFLRPSHLYLHVCFSFIL